MYAGVGREMFGSSCTVAYSEQKANAIFFAAAPIVPIFRSNVPIGSFLRSTLLSYVLTQGETAIGL